MGDDPFGSLKQGLDKKDRGRHLARDSGRVLDEERSKGQLPSQTPAKVATPPLL